MIITNIEGLLKEFWIYGSSTNRQIKCCSLLYLNTKFNYQDDDYQLLKGGGSSLVLKRRTLIFTNHDSLIHDRLSSPWCGVINIFLQSHKRKQVLLRRCDSPNSYSYANSDFFSAVEYFFSRRHDKFCAFSDVAKRIVVLTWKLSNNDIHWTIEIPIEIYHLA